MERQEPPPYVSRDCWDSQLERSCVYSSFGDIGSMLRLIHRAVGEAEVKEVDAIVASYGRSEHVPWELEVPYYWDDAAEALRVWSLVATTSAFEIYMGSIIERCKNCGGAVQKPKRGMSKVKAYQRALEGVSEPHDDLWNDVDNLGSIRNCIVHYGRSITGDKKADVIRTVAKRGVGLTLDSSDSLKIELAFCEWALAKSEALILRVLDDLDAHFSSSVA